MGAVGQDEVFEVGVEGTAFRESLPCSYRFSI